MKLANPLPKSILKKYPAGNIFQYWGENPILYQLRSNGKVMFHNGVDIATFENDEVKAAHTGVVLNIDYNKTGFGNGIWIRGLTEEEFIDVEGDKCIWLTSYWHLNAVNVKVGQPVLEGQTIGYEGNTGFVISGSTIFWGNAPAGKGVHLHFGCKLLKRVDTFSVPEHYTFDGKNYEVKYYYNGVMGILDPLAYIKEAQDSSKQAMNGLLEYLKDVLLKMKKTLSPV